MISEQQRRLLTLCAIRVEHQSIDWNLLARCARDESDLSLLYQGKITESSSIAARSHPILQAGLEDLSGALAKVEHEVAAAESVDAGLVTVLDDNYPTNLRLVANRPPFLFYRGSLHASDARSVAVVGTRAATADGLAKARTFARELVQHQVSVASGLARGVDTAAHTAVLHASGRPLAVIGTGITHCYPPENKALADQVAEHGVLVSQFWPTAGPRRHSFPQRNVVMSGISQGTIVVEASGTSGARMQARIAAEQGKHVFLPRHLVTREEWARRMTTRGQAIEVDSVADIAPKLTSVQALRRSAGQHQLSLGWL